MPKYIVFLSFRIEFTSRRSAEQLSFSNDGLQQPRDIMQRYIWVTGEMFDLTLPSPTGHLSFGGLPEDHLEEPLHNQDHFLKTY